MNKYTIPIMVFLLLVSSSFVGMSNTTEKTAVDAEQPTETTSPGPKDTPWPMKCHDNQHTGRSPYSTINTTDLEKWRFHSTGGVEETPVIDSDGTIYFRGAYNYYSGYIYAVYQNGTEKWKFQAGGTILGSTPAIAEDGTIYFGCWDDYFYAVNPNGTLKWKFLAHDNIASSPAIAEDGTVYFGTMGNGYMIYAINPNGTEKWHYRTGYKVTSDPAIGDDGTVYIGSGDSYLYALYPNGTLKWRFGTGDEIHGHPSIAEDGTIYIGSYDDYLYALFPNGTMKWKFFTEFGTSQAAAIGEDGTIYVGTEYLYAIYPNGTLKWKFDLGTNRWVGDSSPAISADGTIYFGTHIGEGAGGDIIAVNSDGTERWRKRLAYWWIDSSPSIAEDGTVYIGSYYDVSRGYLHAFGPVESNEPPEAPSISGEIKGKTGTEYKYTFAANDPDKNPLQLYIDWGDNTTTSWTREFASDEPVKYEHSWSEDGNYTIKAKVKDVLDEESNWSYLEITMPMNQHSTHPLLLWLLDRFPLLKQLLWRIM